MEKEQNVIDELENVATVFENNLRVLIVLVRAFKHEKDDDERANILELISINLHACGDIMLKSAKFIDALADFY